MTEHPNYMQLAFDKLPLCQGPDETHALARLAVAQQLKRCADQLAAIQASVNDLSALPGMMAVIAGGVAEVGQFFKDAAGGQLALAVQRRAGK